VEGAVIVFVLIALLVLFIVYKTAVVVPQQSAFVVERLGKFAGVLGAGFHILVPFVDVIRYRHSLKERAADIAEQIVTFCRADSVTGQVVVIDGGAFFH